jgi:peptidase inhibitor I78 family protein
MRRVPFARAAIIAAYFGVACATVNDRPTAPTSVEPSSGAPSETHSSTPQPNPPAADRGTPPPPRPSPPAAEDCDATKAQWAIGEPESGELLERARVAAQAKSARFLRPNQIITMEYSSSRLNLHLGTQGVVGSVRCG